MVWQKKATGKSPGYHSYTQEDMKRVNWCMNKGIKIAVVPNGTEWQIDIKVGRGKWHTDPKRYSDEEVHENVIKYYKYYYDKYNK